MGPGPSDRSKEKLVLSIGMICKLLIFNNVIIPYKA